MPSILVISTESVTGYNNYLLKADGGMTFGVNDLVNEKTKQVGIKHNLGFSKVNLLSAERSAPASVPRLRKTLEKQKKPTTLAPSGEESATKAIVSATPTTLTTSSHDLNKTALIIIAAGVGWYVFL